MNRKRINTTEMKVIVEYMKSKKSNNLLGIITRRMTTEEIVKYGIVKKKDITMVDMTSNVSMIDMSKNYEKK